MTEHLCLSSVLCQSSCYEPAAAVELDGRLRFGSGVLSTGIGPDFCPLQQFPLNGCRAADPCIRRDTVLCKKVFTLGLSLRPQLIR